MGVVMYIIVFLVVFIKIFLLPAIINGIPPYPVPPDNISTPGQNATDPQVAIDINGNVIAVWIENGVVKARSAVSNASWSPTIDTLSNSGASSPKITIDDNGTATAIWIEN